MCVDDVSHGGNDEHRFGVEGGRCGGEHGDFVDEWSTGIDKNDRASAEAAEATFGRQVAEQVRVESLGTDGDAQPCEQAIQLLIEAFGAHIPPRGERIVRALMAPEFSAAPHVRPKGSNRR